MLTDAAAARLRTLARRGYAPGGQPCYRFGELPEDETTAGGKARALARLVRAGHPVPDGLVLLPRAFAGDQLTAAAAAALNRQLRRFPADQRFAVRSSARSEDSASASFAGAYESVLDVAAADLARAIAAVRASGAAERVAAYASSSGAEVGELAVIVQAMVPAELAGVVFTVDPISGDLDSMLGSVVQGLGESLVSGDETGSPFRLARPSGAFEGPDVLAPHASALHGQAHRVETTFAGVPQDIEWAVAGDRLWLLQARPITTLNPWRTPTAERNDSLAGTCLWSATNLSEANPVAQTPLTISLSRHQQANGGPSMALRGREMAGFIGGRPYANLSVQITARRGKPGKADPREVYRTLAGWWGTLPDDVPIPLIPMTADDWKQAGLPLLGSLLRMS
ncbi:MAG: PEP/pyruvate-binding domain-containing protein, partial [Propionicimonas sp.]|nr:PEP/pyruvate-binding domain-containing protein [Propionicimonas sp.]